jgi:hypothetical protein
VPAAKALACRRFGWERKQQSHLANETRRKPQPSAARAKTAAAKSLSTGSDPCTDRRKQEKLRSLHSSSRQLRLMISFVLQNCFTFGYIELHSAYFHDVGILFKYGLSRRKITFRENRKIGKRKKR